MPINPALLVMAPVVLNYYYDKDTGAPLSGGKVWFYRDSSRLAMPMLKSIYQQTGVPGNYVYTPIQNPMILNAVGGASSDSIDDITPFYYPYLETNSSMVDTYYIVVENANGVPQETRANFPLTVQSSTPFSETSTLRNFLINGEFWRNVGSVGITSSSTTTLAPSQHDGFSSADITYVTNGTGGSSPLTTISFQKFPASVSQTLSNTITPEFYLDYNCTVPFASQSINYISIPMSLHLATLANTGITLTFWARAVSAEQPISVSYLQYNGTGNTTTAAFPIGTQTLQTGAWQQLSFTFTTNAVNTIPASQTGDDAYYLLFNFPTTTVAEIQIAKPKMYIGNVIPTNDFSTYDEIDTIINSSRTGDLRISINAFAPYGWVLMNDGVIANGAFGMSPTPTAPMSVSVARYNIDTWSLFSLLWPIGNANPSYAPIYDITGASSTYTTLIADWNASKQIQLTKQLGRVLASVGIPSSGGTGTNWAIGQVTGEEKHMQTIPELASHNHTWSPTVSSIIGQAGGGSINVPAGSGAIATNMNTTGSSTPFNVMQPTAFYNVFLKL